MVYRGTRKSVRGSLYGDTIEIMERMGWDWDQYQNAPDDLLCEMEARLHGMASIGSRSGKKGK